MDFGLQQYIELKDVVQEIAKKHGFNLDDFSVVPGNNAQDSPSVRMSLQITEEAFMTLQAKEALKTQKEFEKIVMNIDTVDETEIIKNKMTDEIKRWMDE